MTSWNNPCPVCKKDRFYVDKYKMERSIRCGHLCKSCMQAGELNHSFGKRMSPEAIAKRTANITDETRAKSRANLAMVTNRRPHYEIWVEKYGEEEAQRRSRIFREKQSALRSGKGNPMYGKPSPTGSGNGWSGWYKDHYFRSLHELAFMANVLERYGLDWRTAESKDLRIEYVDPEGATRNYFADFFVHEQVLVEVKPMKLWGSAVTEAKKDAAVAWCHQRMIAFCLVDPPALTTAEIKRVWENGELKWLPRYERRFIEWIENNTT